MNLMNYKILLSGLGAFSLLVFSILFFQGQGLFTDKTPIFILAALGTGLAALLLIRKYTVLSLCGLLLVFVSIYFLESWISINGGYLHLLVWTLLFCLGYELLGRKSKILPRAALLGYSLLHLILGWRLLNDPLWYGGEGLDFMLWNYAHVKDPTLKFFSKELISFFNYLIIFLLILQFGFVHFKKTQLYFWLPCFILHLSAFCILDYELFSVVNVLILVSFWQKKWLVSRNA